jgi:hypothetical protein
MVPRLFLTMWFSLLLLPSSSFGENLKDLMQARKLSDQAVSLFIEEKFVEGYGVLKPFWPLPAVEIDSLANQTNMQWPMVRQRFGKSVGVEFVREQKVGESLIEYVYLQKFQHHALRWVFVFYKPKDQWIINSVSFDDNIKSMF